MSIPSGKFILVKNLASLVLALALIAAFAPAANANNQAVGKVIAELFSNANGKTGVEEIDTNYDRVRAFYESRTFKPVWTRDTGPKGKGKALLKELKRSSVHGLTPEFYNVSRIETLMTASEPQKIAELDMLLSGAMIAFADDLSNGYVRPENAESANAVRRVLVAPDKVISEAADAGNFTAFAKDFLNVDDRYFRLIAKLVEFDRIEEAGLWPAIDANGAEIKIGSNDPRMKDIFQILVLSGVIYPNTTGDPTLHDEASAEAVRLFQRYHGIKPTGVITKETLAEMAVPVAERKRQLLVNLERRRWQNRELGPDHLYVNLANNSARVILNGKKQVDIKLDARGRSQALPTFYGTITGFLIGQGERFNVRLLMENKYVDFPVDDNAAGLFMRMEDLQTFAVLLGIVDIGSAKPGDVIQLEKSIEVFVTYVTAWANKDGSINYRPDVLNRDKAIAQLLRLK